MKLYKFKSCDSSSLRHVLDMIVNERVFLAKAEDMNDPYEGRWEISEGDVDLVKGDLLRCIVDSTRFACFADSCVNELLWAHYAGGFSGVCFEYDIDTEKYDVRKVSYAGKCLISLEQLDRVIEGSLRPQDVGILNSKAECWIYENEYRLFGDLCSKDKYAQLRPVKIIFGGRNLMCDDFLPSIVDKYEVGVAYLMPDGLEHRVVDVKRH